LLMGLPLAQPWANSRQMLGPFSYSSSGTGLGLAFTLINQ